MQLQYFYALPTFLHNIFMQHFHMYIFENQGSHRFLVLFCFVQWMVVLITCFDDLSVLVIVLLLGFDCKTN